MNVLLFLKPIVDMFYEYIVLDYILFAFSIICVIVTIRNIKNFYWTDFISFIIIFLLSNSFLKDLSGIKCYFKILSAFLLYFIGRGSYQNIIRNDIAIIYSHLVVFIVNFVKLMFNSGFIRWGNAITFRGMYFYKSDLAITMIYIVAINLFLTRLNKFIKYIIVAASIIMVILSNSRISIVLLVNIFFLYYIFEKEKNNIKNGYLFRITIKLLFLYILIFFIGIIFIQYIGRLPVFNKFNYITLSFDNFSDLANASNTQGRNIIWKNILNKFKSAPTMNRFIGIDLVSDKWNKFNAHNAYLKLLYSTGYVGIGLFLLFILLMIDRINKIKSRNHFFLTFALLSTFVIQSITQSAIEYTQMTWILFYYLGLLTTMSFEECDYDFYYDEMCIF